MSIGVVNRGLLSGMLFLLFCLCYFTGNACGFCPYDPCMYAPDCEGKTCVTDQCDYSCVCDDHSTSEDCLKASTANPSNFSVSSPSTFSKNTSDSSEDPQCACDHGRCVMTDDDCECDLGWYGQLCNITCTVECGPGEFCHRVNEKMFTCIARETSTPKQSTFSTVTEFNGTTVSRSYNVCDTSYTQRPFSNRSCDGIFECIYGVCERNSIGLRCQCDIGALNTRCQTKCCKPCGDNGECYRIYETDEEVCNCHINYTGDFCEIYDPPKGTGGVIHVTILIL